MMQAKTTKWSCCKVAAQAFVVAGQAAEAAAPGEAAFDDPAPGQQHEAGLAFGLFNNLQVNVMHSRRVFGFFARVALVAKAHLHGLARDFLHPLAEFAHLRPLLLVGRGDDHAQQLAQRVDGDVGLAALAPFGPVVAGPVPALGRALQASARRG